MNHNMKKKRSGIAAGMLLCFYSGTGGGKSGQCIHFHQSDTDRHIQQLHQSRGAEVRYGGV